MPATVLWPARYSLYELMLKRASDGHAAFEAEMQGNPADPSKCEWPSDYWADHIWFDKWPNSIQLRVMAVDPSKGTDSRQGDYSAIVSLAVTADLRLWVDADLKRRDTEAIVADAVQHAKNFKPDIFVIEENAFQHLLRPRFLEIANKEITQPMQVIGYTNTVPKVVRIRRLTPYLAQRRLFMKARSPGAALLVQQGQQFGTDAHDDGLDALEMALRAAIERWNSLQH